ncbi:MAG: phosphatidylinositol alpha-mannosyltransferase [Candidatus Saccharimonadales bacterium]|jgi:phosphatidylinositol alpha-mannosyltransferase
MVIGYLLDDTLDKPDGVQQAMIAIGENMKSKGHEVHYIVAETSRTDLTNIHSVGKFISLKFNGNSIRTPLPASRTAIKRLLNQIDFDVLHVQMPYSPLLTAKVMKMAPKSTKRFGTFHILPYNSAANIGTKFVGMIMQRSIRSLDKCLAVSSPALKFMEKSFGVKGTVLGNPVDYNFYNSVKPKKYDKLQFVFVGRFDERKGVLQLAEAFKQLDKETRDKVQLTMCSKGPLLEKVKKISEDNNLGIKFPGFISEEEKAQYLASADLAIFPSINGESFGIVLTEAMSAGAKLTIGGNNPGYSSVLEHWPEVLFDPTNVVEFSGLLKSYIDDPKQFMAIGKLQHEHVKRFDIEKITDTLIGMYSD